MRWPALAHAVLAIGTGIALAACGSAGTSSSATVPSAGAPKLARWQVLVHVKLPLDVVGPRADGSFVLGAAGRLWLLRSHGAVVPYAPRYRSPGGEEPYIALAPRRSRRDGCSFVASRVYALRLVGGRGVVAVDAQGNVHRFATLTAPGLIDGITFDRTGRFGRRLLVTINAGARTTVDAIGCNGSVTAITRDAPRVEGGLTVAPPTFGRYAGDLIAPDETGGRIFAITPRGRSLLVADSGLPHGNDIGVESTGFEPPGALQDALVADRRTPGNRHPGDDAVLRLAAAALRGAGVRAGDLLVATEGGARTDAVRCSASGCRVRHIADGPAVAHVEGHIAFVPAR